MFLTSSIRQENKSSYGTSLSKYVKLIIKLGLLGLSSIFYICDDFMLSFSKIRIWFAFVAVAETSNFDSLVLMMPFLPSNLTIVEMALTSTR